MYLLFKLVLCLKLCITYKKSAKYLIVIIICFFSVILNASCTLYNNIIEKVYSSTNLALHLPDDYSKQFDQTYFIRGVTCYSLPP